MKIKTINGQMSLVPVLIGIMVAVIIGVAVIIPIIQNIVTTATTVTSTSQNNIASLNATTTTLAYGDLVSGSFQAWITNATASPAIPYQRVGPSNYTLTLGSQNTLATVSWMYADNALLTQNATKMNVTYSYYPSTYIQNPIVVSLLNLIPLFIVLVLLIGAVALVKF